MTPRTGAGFTHAILDGGLHVTILFGRPTAAGARELVGILEKESFSSPRRSLFDAGRVEAIETDAFAVLTEHQTARAADLARVVQRQAIVFPQGMAGAIVAGYRTVVPLPYPVEYFPERAAALAYLERPDALAAVDALAAAADTHPLVRDVRALLLASPRLSLAQAAQRLSVSERSLQRHLQSVDTSYLDELRAARIAVAKHALVETDRKLAAIAHDVGCSSLASFSAMFRRATGETPSAYRSRLRR